MQDQKKTRKTTGAPGDLPPEENQSLNQLKAEDTPENLLRLAKRLQDALDEKLRLSRH
jgi:hypothetical protein